MRAFTLGRPPTAKLFARKELVTDWNRTHDPKSNDLKSESDGKNHWATGPIDWRRGSFLPLYRVVEVLKGMNFGKELLSLWPLEESAVFALCSARL